MSKRIKRVLAGLVVSGALTGGAIAGTAALTATPAQGLPIGFFFPCVPHGHEMIFCKTAV